MPFFKILRYDLVPARRLKNGDTILFLDQPDFCGDFHPVFQGVHQFLVEPVNLTPQLLQLVNESDAAGIGFSQDQIVQQRSQFFRGDLLLCI